MKLAQHHKHQAIHHVSVDHQTHRYILKPHKTVVKKSKILLTLFITVLLLITIFIVKKQLWNGSLIGQSTNQKQYYFGIGIGITFYNDQAIVSRIIPGTPAEKAGIQLNDIIVAVDSIPINTKNSRNLCWEIRGQNGSAVNLSIERQKNTFDKKITRTKIYSRTPTMCQ